jgi:hypothetical protein
LPDKRLRERYLTLVKQHCNSVPHLACGMHALPSAASAFAATQAAWRFFDNDRVKLPDLIQPLLHAARKAVQAAAAPYVLDVVDWSSLHYYSHSDKTDQKQLSHKKDRGYELTTHLLVDTHSGAPLAPVELRLAAAGSVYSTRQPAPSTNAFRLDQVRPAMRAIAGLGLARQIVHVIDAEADSVAHLRDWDKDGRLFLVRTDGRRLVRYQGRLMLLSKVVEELRSGNAFSHSRQITYQGHKATQYVAETLVVLDRPAQRQRRRGKNKRKRVPGKALTLRLVVSEIRGERGEVLSPWRLLSNVPAEVEAAEIALWYYWRWRIESYFKLLESAGQELENWLQETAERIAKRLVVASMACVVAWEVARAEGPDAEAARGLLIRLSGRQMKRGVAWTLPALLAGLWPLLALVEELRHSDLDEILRLAQVILPHASDPGAQPQHPPPLTNHPPAG